MKGGGKMAGKIKTRICFASLIYALVLLLASEFVADGYYDGVWRIRGTGQI